MSYTKRYSKPYLLYDILYLHNAQFLSDNVEHGMSYTVEEDAPFIKRHDASDPSL